MDVTNQERQAGEIEQAVDEFQAAMRRALEVLTDYGEGIETRRAEDDFVMTMEWLQALRQQVMVGGSPR